jgi:cytochrome c-type biogenesis protein CcmH/NrfG
MLALSVVPLLRYARSHEQLPPAPLALALPGAAPQPIVTSAVSSAARAREVAADTEAKAAQEREQQLASLVAAGNRALDTEAIPEAERLFGRVVELDQDNPRAAFGLARIRLLQGNLSGAEGWIQLALRKRPKRSAYHALYAEILTRLGRDDEAQDEQRHTAAKDIDEER